MIISAEMPGYIAVCWPFVMQNSVLPTGNILAKFVLLCMYVLASCEECVVD